MGKRAVDLGKSRTFYYAIAGFIAVVAIGLGAWFLTDIKADNKLASSRPAGVEQTAGNSNQRTVGSDTLQAPGKNVSASNEGMEQIANEASQDLAEIESILAEIDKIDVSQDKDVGTLNF
ncbi:MAG: hypothetical protein M1548_10240 [Actinobacteria bacterium]|nr:hypothetical protein [Actinomycetota bacterium]